MLAPGIKNWLVESMTGDNFEINIWQISTRLVKLDNFCLDDKNGVCMISTVYGCDIQKQKLHSWTRKCTKVTFNREQFLMREQISNLQRPFNAQNYVHVNRTHSFANHRSHAGLSTICSQLWVRCPIPWNPLRVEYYQKPIHQLGKNINLTGTITFLTDL